MGGPIKIGSVTIDTIGQLKVGSSNVQQAYVGSVLVFPATITEPTYDVYYATEFSCSSCIAGAFTVVAFLSGTSVSLGSYYLPQTSNGNSYRVDSLPGPMDVNDFWQETLIGPAYASCAIACGI